MLWVADKSNRDNIRTMKQGEHMKVVVFGGTGQTGQHLVRLALEKGYAVRVLARTPDKLSIQDPNLEIIQGNTDNIADVSAAVVGQDAVLCAIGGAGLKDNTSRTIGTKNIVSAMNEHGVSTIIVCSSMGQGKSKDQMGFMGRMFLNFVLKNPMIDHAGQEKAIMESDTRWVIVRPPRLIEGPKAEIRCVEESEEGFIGTQIARINVAQCMLDALDGDHWIGKAWSISE